MSWRFGAASADITPTRPQYMMGYYRPDRSAGTYHPLYARALYMTDCESDCVLIAADLIGFMPPDVARYRKAVSEAVGIPPRRIILCATHTHTGPRISELSCWAGEVDAAYLDSVECAFCEAAVTARRKARPGAMLFSRIRSRLGVNRRRWENGQIVMKPNPEGSHDRAADTRWFLDRSGGVIATITTYGCHPTALGGYLIGGDYPGFFKDGMDDATGGISLWTGGCGGDVRPWFTGNMEEFGGRTVEAARAMGSAHAREVLAGRKHATPVELRRLCVSGKDVRLPVQKPWTLAEMERIAGPAAVHEQVGRARFKELHAAARRRRFAPSEAQVISFNTDHHMVFWGGEICSQVGLGLKDLCPGKIVTVSGYSNSTAAYVASENMFLAGGYEVDQSMYYYVLPAPLVPKAQEYLWRPTLRCIAAHAAAQQEKE